MSYLRFNAQVVAVEKVSEGEFTMALFLNDKHIVDEIMVPISLATDFYVGRNFRLELVPEEAA